MPEDTKNIHVVSAAERLEIALKTFTKEKDIDMSTVVYPTPIAIMTGTGSSAKMRFGVLVQAGLVQASPKVFFIKDSVTGEWLYAFPSRVDELRKKNGNDFSKYLGRSSLRIAREAQKADRKAANAKRAEERAKAKAEKAALGLGNGGSGSTSRTDFLSQFGLKETVAIPAVGTKVQVAARATEAPAVEAVTGKGKGSQKK